MQNHNRSALLMMYHTLRPPILQPLASPETASCPGHSTCRRLLLPLMFSAPNWQKIKGRDYWGKQERINRRETSSRRDQGTSSSGQIFGMSSYRIVVCPVIKRKTVSVEKGSRDEFLLNPFKHRKNPLSTMLAFQCRWRNFLLKNLHACIH